MPSTSIYLGVILVIAMIIIAFFALRHWKKRSGGADRFTYATPATPRIREAVGDLYASLKHMVVLGRSFEDQASRPAFAGRADIQGARRGAAQMVEALDRAEKGLSGAPPTYANYLAVYRGLMSTDRTLLGAADAYINAGHGVHQGVVLSGSGEEAALGNTLLAMGRQLRQVVAGVHRLGVALDVE